MGVAGAGKTTLARALALALGWEFFDADDYHSDENVALMRRGVSLTDELRAPWLRALCDLVDEVLDEGRCAVLACSALTEAYRHAIVPADAPAGTVRFLYLRVPREVLSERLETRTDHFASADLLDSQLATLEEPVDAVILDGTRPVDELVREAREAMEIEGSTRLY